MSKAIRALTHRSFARWVDPLIDAHWPGLRSDAFLPKLYVLACDLYATAPYTVLFCAPNRPWPVRLVTGPADRLALPAPLLGLGVRVAMAAIGRGALQREHRRIILVAAFIAVIDHAFDHGMDDDPEGRGAKLHALLDGSLEPDTPVLALTRALQVEMGRDLAADERVPFEAAMGRVRDWIDSEVAGLGGLADDTGLGHRLAGIEGTIDGLVFPVHRFAGEGARRWMYDVSLFVQMMDDYLDLDEDLVDGRLTPVISGEWTFPEIERTWRRTVDGIEALIHAGGLRSGRYAGFVRDAYVLMIGELLDAMCGDFPDRAPRALAAPAPPAG